MIMEDGGQNTGGGGGGGPAPFLQKTYDMVDDISTDDIVSWSSSKNSFVVWNSPEFARLLLPTYFKHNNFSSFIRQLNTYGFRKIDPERWEFANEDFIKDQKHLLKNIHRRKPIHSHTQPQGSLGDSERAAFEEEIERLTQEKTALQTKLSKFKQQSGTKLQLEDLGKRVQEMEERQLRMMSFLAKASENPNFVDHLIRMAGSHLDLSAIYKKRRLPKVGKAQEISEIIFVDNNSCISKPDAGHIFNQDFSSRLRLELSPAVSDCNMVSLSAHGSSEDGGSPQKKTSEEDPKDANMRTQGLSYEPEILEPLDMGGISFALRKDDSFSRQPSLNDLSSTEEGDGHISCHLNLTLASSSLQLNNNHYCSRFPQLGQEIVASSELKSSGRVKEAELRIAGPNRKFADDNPNVSSSQEPPVKSGAIHDRVNDVFWEQFLTERPGSSDTEEASSSFRANSYEEQEERKAGNGRSWRNKKDMEQLTL